MPARASPTPKRRLSGPEDTPKRTGLTAQLVMLLRVSQSAKCGCVSVESYKRVVELWVAIQSTRAEFSTGSFDDFNKLFCSSGNHVIVTRAKRCGVNQIGSHTERCCTCLYEVAGGFQGDASGWNQLNLREGRFQ